MEVHASLRRLPALQKADQLKVKTGLVSLRPLAASPGVSRRLAPLLKAAVEREGERCRDPEIVGEIILLPGTLETVRGIVVRVGVGLERALPAAGERGEGRDVEGRALARYPAAVGVGGVWPLQHLDGLVGHASGAGGLRVRYGGDGRVAFSLGRRGAQQRERYCVKTEVVSVTLWMVVVRSIVVSRLSPGPE